MLGLDAVTSCWSLVSQLGCFGLCAEVMSESLSTIHKFSTITCSGTIPPDVLSIGGLRVDAVDAASLKHSVGLSNCWSLAVGCSYHGFSYCRLPFTTSFSYCGPFTVREYRSARTMFDVCSSSFAASCRLLLAGDSSSSLIIDPHHRHLTRRTWKVLSPLIVAIEWERLLLNYDNWIAIIELWAGFESRCWTLLTKIAFDENFSFRLS